MKENSRPYFKKTVHDLSELFNNNQANIRQLQIILGELEHRSVPKALELRSKVESQIEYIKNKKQTSYYKFCINNKSYNKIRSTVKELYEENFLKENLGKKSYVINIYNGKYELLYDKTINNLIGLFSNKKWLFLVCQAEADALQDTLWGTLCQKYKLDYVKKMSILLFLILKAKKEKRYNRLLALNILAVNVHINNYKNKDQKYKKLYSLFPKLTEKLRIFYIMKYIKTLNFIGLNPDRCFEIIMEKEIKH